MTEQHRREHFNFLLYKEIDMNLDLASDLTFDLLEDADVDDDKIDELKHMFVMAQASLDCLTRA